MLYIYIYMSKAYKSARNTIKKPHGIRGPINFGIPESQKPRIKMKKSYVIPGDTITIDSNNQQGHKIYKVIKNSKGDKDLVLIDSYEMQMDKLLYSPENSPDRSSSPENSPDRSSSGGKNRRKKHRTRRHKK